MSDGDVSVSDKEVEEVEDFTSREAAGVFIDEFVLH